MARKKHSENYDAINLILLFISICRHRRTSHIRIHTLIRFNTRTNFKECFCFFFGKFSNFCWLPNTLNAHEEELNSHSNRRENRWQLMKQQKCLKSTAWHFYLSTYFVERHLNGDKQAKRSKKKTMQIR